MNRFATLYRRLDQSNRTNDKVAALIDYFRDAPPKDAAWAAYFLTGHRIKRAVNHRLLREAAAEASGLPMWLLDESYQHVGDLSETIALLIPEQNAADAPPLHTLIEDILAPMPAMNDRQRIVALKQTWAQLDAWQRFCFHKLISGAFRVGVATTLVARALAEVAGVEQAVMAHRLTGGFEPSARHYRAILTGEGLGAADMLRPYPFCLATQLDAAPDTLGSPSDYLVEWKWDGIRAQAIRRDGRAALWSRGEASIADTFPEIVAGLQTMPDGTVIDGEVLAWDAPTDRPAGFNALQTRLNRKRVEPTLFDPPTPIIFMAYDVLEHDGQDVRDRPTADRRALLEQLLRPADPPLRLSPIIVADTWDQLAGFRGESRRRGVEGLMLKHRASPYEVGRKRGGWWKWKIDPFTLDAVMVNAQRGHGKRAGLFSDYSFALWDNTPPPKGDGQLVTIAKAYSGLTNDELEKLDAWVRQHTVERRGPVHLVEPVQVFELAFEGVRESPRHKAGLAVRFPRMNRWRTDKPPEEADRLGTLRAMLHLPEVAS